MHKVRFGKLKKKNVMVSIWFLFLRTSPRRCSLQRIRISIFSRHCIPSFRTAILLFSFIPSLMYPETLSSHCTKGHPCTHCLYSTCIATLCYSTFWHSFYITKPYQGVVFHLKHSTCHSFPLLHITKLLFFHNCHHPFLFHHRLFSGHSTPKSQLYKGLSVQLFH